MKQFAHLRVSLKVEKFLAEFKCSTNSRSFVSMSGDDEVLNESLSALVSFVSLSSSSNLNKLLSSTKRCSENSHKFKFDIKRLRSSSSWRWWKLSCRSTNCIVNFSSSILSDISRYTYIDLQKHIRFIRQRASRTKYDVNVFAVRKDLACFIIKCTTPAHHEPSDVEAALVKHRETLWSSERVQLFMLGALCNIAWHSRGAVAVLVSQIFNVETKIKKNFVKFSKPNFVSSVRWRHFMNWIGSDTTRARVCVCVCDIYPLSRLANCFDLFHWNSLLGSVFERM